MKIRLKQSANNEASCGISHLNSEDGEHRPADRAEVERVL